MISRIKDGEMFLSWDSTMLGDQVGVALGRPGAGLLPWFRLLPFQRSSSRYLNESVC